MSLWQILLILFCGLGLVQSLFLSTSLFIKDKYNFIALFYAVLLLLGLALRLVNSIIVFISIAYSHWGVVVGAARLWMIGPSFYLYTIHSIDPQRKPSLLNGLHF